jgi:hypothetical protein
MTTRIRENGRDDPHHASRGLTQIAPAPRPESGPDHYEMHPLPRHRLGVRAARPRGGGRSARDRPALVDAFRPSLTDDGLTFP